MILDKESAKFFRTYAEIDQKYRWRAFKVLGEWGFSEIGLVNSLSSALSSAGVESPLFLSTFSRDFIIVPSEVEETAKEAFIKAGFMVS
ncbi:hypothetical protein BVRB_035000 [Beta vulgaris subsp. vulgaris]|uniref:CASTOR ACT domain-containing protein n=1 Tax=Beta vulgaris subsp. vulgaris TaxID=3555 RepID=A0A0J8BIQ6_BETVV|nr:hypothetical protein BVRB_035000 [Beta vulgaris subsp. vulgaris]